jgi:Interferon-induced transmembrane protein
MIFCSQCLTGNAEDALYCSTCGAHLNPAGEIKSAAEFSPRPRTGVRVPNYMLFAVLVTILCFLPTGIIAIIDASQVNSRLALGDIAGAKRASKNAQMWCLISLGIGLFGGLMFVLLFTNALTGFR